MTPTMFIIFILFVAPFTKADTIQIFNYNAEKHKKLEHDHEVHAKNIEHVKYLIDNLHEILEKAELEEESSQEIPTDNIIIQRLNKNGDELKNFNQNFKPDFVGKEENDLMQAEELVSHRFEREAEKKPEVQAIQEPVQEKIEHSHPVLGAILRQPIPNEKPEPEQKPML